jgi:hypothetical protein
VRPASLLGSGWFHLSNTFFFDKCLGWAGLCVEPTPDYWPELQKHRGCTLIKECISNENRSVFMSRSGVNSKLTGNGGYRRHRVQCNTLRHMLDRVGQRDVDFWSLDVEGHESVVMHQYEPSDVHVSTMLIEDGGQPPRAFDYLMNKKGFVKFYQLLGDAVYVSRSSLDLVPADVWLFPDNIAYPGSGVVRTDHLDQNFLFQEKAWKCNQEALKEARNKCVCLPELTSENDKSCMPSRKAAHSPVAARSIQAKGRSNDAI